MFEATGLGTCSGLPSHPDSEHSPREMRSPREIQAGGEGRAALQLKVKTSHEVTAYMACGPREIRDAGTS